MGATPKVYVICDSNCKYEGLTKEQILTAITQAVEKGTITDVDTGFITTVKTINGTGLKFFVGEQHEYDALTEEQKQGLFAIITNDTTREGLLNSIKSLENSIESLGLRAAALEKWNESEGVYSRKAEARHTVTEGFVGASIYNGNALMVDLSHYMLAGKTANDTIGISGSFNIYVDGEESGVTARYSTLWNYSERNRGTVFASFVCRSKVYLLNFDVELNDNNELRCLSSGFYINSVYSPAFNITDNVIASISKIDIHELNIFYR